MYSIFQWERLVSIRHHSDIDFIQYIAHDKQKEISGIQTLAGISFPTLNHQALIPDLIDGVVWIFFILLLPIQYYLINGVVWIFFILLLPIQY